MNNKKDITPRNDKGQRHGYWEVYYCPSDIWFKCICHNGKVIGYEEQYGYSKLTKNYHL